MARPKLVFVYNADSGLFNTLGDIAHKMFSPHTYQCQLCALTHSYFSMRQEWGSFLADLDAELDFLHRDQLVEKFGLEDAELPAIFQQEGNSLRPFIQAGDINACTTMDDLKSLIRVRLAAV